MTRLPDPLPPAERFRIGLIARMYTLLMGRQADPGGLRALLDRMRDGIPFSTAVTEALDSDEFRARCPDPALTVDDIDALFAWAWNEELPPVDRTLPPGAYAAALLTAAETRTPSTICDALFSEGADPADPGAYRLWLHDYATPDPRTLLKAAIGRPPATALSLILLDGWSASRLAGTLTSLRDQISGGYQVVIAGRPRFCATLSDALPAPVAPVSARGMAARLNAALPLCKGRFVLPLGPGTRLAPDAVWHVAEAALADPDAPALLLDHDRIDAQERRSAPVFHAGWDPELALCRNDWAVGMALRTDLAAARRARPEAGSAAWADLALRVIEADGASVGRDNAGRDNAGRDNAVRHVARPLVQVPLARGPLAWLSKRRLRRAWDRQVEARWAGRPDAPRLVRQPGAPAARIVYPLPRQPPLVSVVIPTRDRADLLRPCLDGLLTRTRYPALDIVVIDNRSSDPDALACLQDAARDPRVRVLRHDARFNWGAVNNIGVRMSRGEIVLLLNNDTEVLQPDWLEELVRQALRPEVGAVGTKLLYRDRTVQHAGLVLGPDGHAFHRFRHVAGDAPGYRDALATVRSVTAVTGACLAMRRTVFEEVGGIEEGNLAVTWSDVDLCYRVRAAGYRVICTPFAPLLHLELATRGKDDTPDRAARAERERQFMMLRWPSLANEDSLFNPNFRLAEGDTMLACPPRAGGPDDGKGNVS
ncbi:glycosyltransferase family 2 protein [Rhodopila sp.]|uniref:glycosyltransferase family 2 protein n=1 Tax=Rhodopila sp. TaxID=2480087 RepID=UPI002BEEB9BD|nr:glycosyltransferase family 2 protein [Rhodopila sp.]HVZ10616.1 glycosyltransferase family 2 protein [Rhodopila sp.]